MKDISHYTFDLETLGSNSQAPIVQIAAVEFTTSGDVIREFNQRIFLNYNFPDFTADIGTIEWWLKQNDRARYLVFGEGPDLVPRTDLRSALNALNSWLIHSTKPKKYWSHATFDPPILMHAYRKMEMRSEMSFRDFMDIRTLNLLAGEILSPVRESFGEHHDAIADCKYQAAYIASGLRNILAMRRSHG